MSIIATQISLQVKETARQVASSPTPTIPVPYDQMKSQCEALVKGKKEKMSVLRSFKQQQVDCRVMPEEKIPDAVDANQAKASLKNIFRPSFFFRWLFTHHRDSYLMSGPAFSCGGAKINRKGASSTQWSIAEWVWGVLQTTSRDPVWQILESRWLLSLDPGSVCSW